MRKLYSLVLMATALLIGTNAWAETRQVGSIADLETAWQNAENGDTIQLTKDLKATKTFWLGTETKNGTSRSLTLDLNGWTLEDNVTGGENGLQSLFLISHGELNVITSLPGGTISASSYFYHSATNHGNMQNVFGLSGTDEETIDAKLNPSSAYTHLTIGEGVTVNANYQNAIVVDYIDNFWPIISADNAVAATGTSKYCVNGDNFRGGSGYPVAAPYQFIIDNSKSAGDQSNHRKLANGVRVDVYGAVRAVKYGIKINGWTQKPNNIEASAFVNIHSTGDIYSTGSAAVYSSGYGRWLIEGKCEGQTGVHIKGGQVEIHDATISSNYSGTYTPPENTTGVSGAGSAIVVHSTTNTDYAGFIEVTISGDTKVTATNGYAIEECITKYDYQGEGDAKTKVTSVEIDGGTFQGGNVGTAQNPVEGTIIITNTTVANSSVTVNGGQVNGEDANSVQIGGQSLADFLSSSSNQTHITYVDNGNGTTMVISQGAAPAEKTLAEAISAYNKWVTDGKPEADSVSVKLTGAISEANGRLEANYEFKELELNSSDAQVLTVVAGNTLKVGRVVLGKNAQIIVEPGAKFIVYGSQGIVAPVVSNIVLRAEEGNPSIFVFNPGVTSNKHPKATVEFVSRSFTVNSSNYAFQRFGIPTTGKLADITTKYNNADVATYFMNYDYAADDWASIGYINAAGKPQLDTAKLSNPFEYYQMQHNTPNMGTVVTFKGELVGNVIPQLAARADFWNGYANSCTGTMSIREVLNELPAGSKSVYLNNVQAHQKVWEPYSFLNSTGKMIQPMQPFLVRNTGAAASVALNYGDAVYYPTTGETKPNAAPARNNALNNITIANIVVNGENTYDRVIVAEDAMFSTDFEDGYDAVKFMNSGINMYVSADEKMSIFATDNLENTYVGFQSVEGGKYTISFADVKGDELTLIDHLTGARVAMVEGTTYEFNADANTVNDYRFEIVGRQNMPTAIDNTEAVKSVKGVYTITGQYVGEMNVWNTLPAGVYVVNGEKRVK